MGLPVESGSALRPAVTNASTNNARSSADPAFKSQKKTRTQGARSAFIFINESLRNLKRAVV